MCLDDCKHKVLISSPCKQNMSCIAGIDISINLMIIWRNRGTVLIFLVVLVSYIEVINMWAVNPQQVLTDNLCIYTLQFSMRN
jgi:hypothetical protein